MFFVEKDAPGVKIKRTPEFTHHFAFKHPEFTFEDVVVDESKILKGIGEGFTMTKDAWASLPAASAARSAC